MKWWCVRLAVLLLVICSIPVETLAYRFRPPSPPNVESSVGTNEWAVEAEALAATGQFLPPWEVVSDTSASGGSYLRLGGDTDYRHQVCMVTDFCTGASCYVWLEARAPASSQDNVVWLDNGGTGAAGYFPPAQELPPSNVKATVLFGNIETPAWTFHQVGHRATESLIPREDTISPRPFTFTNGGKLCLTAQAGVEIDTIFFALASNATPKRPGGGGSQADSYTVLDGSAGMPTANGTEGATEWINYPAIPWLGQDTGTATDWTAKLAWNKTNDQVCMFAKGTLANMDTACDGEDASNCDNSTGVNVYLRCGDQTATLDAATFYIKLTANAGSPVWRDGNFPSGTFSSTPDVASRTQGATYSGNVATVEGCFTSPVPITTDQQCRVDVRVSEKTTGASVLRQSAWSTTGGFSASSGYVRFSGTAVPPAEDMSDPVVGALSTSGVTTSGFTATFSASDAQSGIQSCHLRYDTDNDGAVSGGDISVPEWIAGTHNGTNCSVTISGRPASQFHNIQGRATNGSGRTALTAVSSVTTDAANADRVVRKTGNNANPCTAASPCLTVARGLESMSGGQTLLIGDGVYNEVINTNQLKNGNSWSNATTIKAENPKGATLRPADANACAAGYQGTTVVNVGAGRRYIIFDGLDIDANYLCPTTVYVRSNTGGVGVDHIRFINNLIRRSKGSGGSAGAGVGLIGGGHQKLADNVTPTPTNNIEFINNEIREGAWAPPGIQDTNNHCVYWKGSQSLFRGNEIYNCYGSNITFHNPAGDDNIVERNILHDTGQAALRLGGKRHKARNNIIYRTSLHQTEPGMVINLSDPEDVELDNNTCYQCSAAGSSGCIRIGSSTDNALNAKVRNNICFGGSNDRIWDISSTNLVTSGNRCTGTGCALSDNPLFVNAGASDFHLQAVSPMINAGTTISGITNDFDGDTRPQGGAFDIGADERP